MEAKRQQKNRRHYLLESLLRLQHITEVRTFLLAEIRSLLSIQSAGICLWEGTDEIEELCIIAMMAISNAHLYGRLQSVLNGLEEGVKKRSQELEEAQAQLIQSEKMAMLGTMVAGIAHEINSPAGATLVFLRFGIMQRKGKKNFQYTIPFFYISQKTKLPSSKVSLKIILYQKIIKKQKLSGY